MPVADGDPERESSELGENTKTDVTSSGLNFVMLIKIGVVFVLACIIRLHAYKEEPVSML